MVSFIRDQFHDLNETAANDPTPDQIRRRAAAIRKRWSPAQRQRRRAQATNTWLLPLVRVDDVLANVPSAQSN